MMKLAQKCYWLSRNRLIALLLAHQHISKLAHSLLLTFFNDK